LGLDASDIDGRWPVQEVSTGLSQLIVPLKSMKALKAIELSKQGYQRITEGTTAKTVLAFCPEAYQEGESLAVRVFPIGVGIAEDPATGSGNGCLAAYLVKHRYLGTDHIDIRVGQGYEVGRPSRLYLRAREEGASIRVSVGGKVTQVADGRWGT
jgi:trans-2,3-dihydro-3-hydroxyanthranilate isomerase